MQGKMMTWQWVLATSVASMTALVGWLSFADTAIDRKIEMSLRAPKALIDGNKERLDRIEDKIDLILKEVKRKE